MSASEVAVVPIAKAKKGRNELASGHEIGCNANRYVCHTKHWNAGYCRVCILNGAHGPLGEDSDIYFNNIW